MGLLSKLFGGGDALAGLRKAVRQCRWADALIIAEDLAQSQLPEDLAQERAQLEHQAGDQLALVNRDEYEACLRSGDLAKAAEHLALARQQVRSEELRHTLDELAIANASYQQGKSKAAPRPVVTGGCASCGGHSSGHHDPLPEEMENTESFDVEIRLELILASYPPELAKRYQQIDGPFLDAFLLAHEGQANDALILFEDVPPGLRDDLYHFERGSLLARLGHNSDALHSLREALAVNPELELALEALVQLEVALGHGKSAKDRLQKSLEQGVASGLCHALLAGLLLRGGDQAAAYDHALQAWNSGRRDGDTALLLAHLLERRGDLGQAEALLQQLGGGGCGGGTNLHLAEFWLRQGRNLEKAQKQFGQALNQEPDNPRWLFRLGESYWRQGRKGEGEQLLQKAMQHSNLDPGLRQAGETLLGL